VGVKAPGNPTRITFFPAQRSAMLNDVGGKTAWSRLTDGISAPTVINPDFNFFSTAFVAAAALRVVDMVFNDEFQPV